VPAREKGMARWRRFLFAFMQRNAVSPAIYLKIPPESVLEIGVQMEF
jgi:KUP system potassium uptake protein